jgi:uncharacterized membrane protein
MELLVLGLAIWWIAHLQKTAGAPLRQKLIGTLGADSFRGVISLLLVISLVLIVVGWRSTTPVAVYEAPAWGSAVAMPLVLLALYLFVASAQPSNVKRLLRHPQLTGLAVWALAHLLSNGDNRSLVLFGGLGLWALVEMPLINRRDGAREQPEAVPMAADVRLVVMAVVAFAVLFLVHPYLFGASPSPR